MQKRLLKLAAAAFVISLSACGLLPDKVDETANWSAPRLYSEAKDEMNSGGYDKAIKYFEKLESRYPFGTYAQQAQMDIAYAHYRQGEQPEALAAIDRFIKLHPNHPNVDYMYYLRGLVNFNDKVSIFDFLSSEDATERDPKAARDAFDAFKQVVVRFPDSTYAPDSLDRMKYLVNALAQYDVHVASYYYRRGAYVAAANRAQSAIQEYRDAPAVEEALHIMVESYAALGMTQLHDDSERVLKKTYPNSVYVGGTGTNSSKVVAKEHWWKFW
ncbi:putative component of the lipoprotein assembly complex (forms a complex with YaeT, YfgL, and NlpB) [Collimonas arenae]|uniref:Outer membrane protein assembly factor BamD n=1 Tax=Collimonas arenae TaxID=279058 RepID=A0A0A1FBA8_9BURK|nr:outer membrane protein assembly factor BamD [Collimonas arenae]AIY42038.1 putative component of the lipoprotein assembly complex (forms a complex with YaeT, YfgL, and NlpB) [Collimonas arenae]